MMAPAQGTTLIERLPSVRGSYTPQAPLAKFTWFRVGGPAEVLFQPKDPDDLASFLSNKPADVPVTVLGVGSNVMVRDGGIPGVVIRLRQGFMEISAEETSAGVHVTAGAGALDITVARWAAKHGIAGLEFLSGVPGTIGGALHMNAGAYGSELGDVFAHAHAITPAGEIRRLESGDMGFTYRHTAVSADWIFISATLIGEQGDSAEIESRMAHINEEREASQPIRERTGGSTFVNPPGHKAWQLIDEAGCRGLKLGAAQVSEKHCNFLINNGSATARDLEALGEEVRRRVKAHTGVTLTWEIRRIGRHASDVDIVEGEAQ